MCGVLVEFTKTPSRYGLNRGGYGNLVSQKVIS
jgi:hypothetical protein